MNYAVIMAGGTGKRLWPLSRQQRPKQVLELVEGQTLLRKCFDNLTQIFDLENIIVLTNAKYVGTVGDNLSELPKENIVAEPAVRDTASAIGLAATILHKRDADATMAIVTADQWIKPVETFKAAMDTALSFVDENNEAFVTFGIKPTFPSSQFGYLKFGLPKPCNASQDAVHVIDSFVEKPNEDTARKYLDEGNYSWNSGMFIWKCETILESLTNFVPGSVEPLQNIRDAWGTPDQEKVLNEWFPQMPKISIDFAVMEKAENVYGIELDCTWHDLGSFTALRDIIKPDENGNIVISEFSQMLDSENNIVVTENKGHLITLIGVENMIVARTPDATLVCPVDQADRLKELLDHIDNDGQGDFL